MTKGVQLVLADALRLAPEVRAELASELLASLDGPADGDAEAAWNVEIERRIEAIESGEIELEPWEQVKHRIERDVLGVMPPVGTTAADPDAPEARTVSPFPTRP